MRSLYTACYSKSTVRDLVSMLHHVSRNCCQSQQNQSYILYKQTISLKLAKLTTTN